MRKIIRTLFIATALASASAAAAWANAGDDGNAGLDALNKGSYDQAIRLFSRALKSGELTGDDKEFAYLNRGKAYLGKNQYKLAVADLKAALKLKPDDSDAQAALDQAQSSASDGSRAAQTASGAGWGLLGELAGHYFWYEFSGKDPHLAVIHFQWAEPQQTLDYLVRSKSGAVVAGTYKLDPAANKIVEAEATTTATYYGTVSASQSNVTDFFFINATPSKVVTTRAPDGGYVEKAQNYVNGAWQDADIVTLVELPQADAESQGFFKPAKP